MIGRMLWVGVADLLGFVERFGGVVVRWFVRLWRFGEWMVLRGDAVLKYEGGRYWEWGVGTPTFA